MGALAIVTTLHALVAEQESAIAELPVRSMAALIIALLWMPRLHRLNVR
jgi:hypothetical protein